MDLEEKNLVMDFKIEVGVVVLRLPLTHTWYHSHHLSAVLPPPRVLCAG